MLLTLSVVPIALTVSAALISLEIHYCCFYDSNLSFHSAYPKVTMYTCALVMPICPASPVSVPSHIFPETNVSCCRQYSIDSSKFYVPKKE